MAFENVNDAAPAVSTPLVGLDRDLAIGATAQPTLPAPAANTDLVNTAAPDLKTQAPAVGSFGDKLSRALADATAQPGAPQALKQPGGFARLFLGASIDAMSKTPSTPSTPHGLGVGLGVGGDAGSNLSPGQGALAGIAKAQKEVAALKQQKAQSALENRKLSDEEKRDQAAIEEAHVHTIQGQQAIQKQSEDLRKESLSDGQSFVKTYEDNGYGIEKGLTLQELQKRDAADPNYAKTHQAVKTQETPMLDSNGQVKKDANGNNIYTPLYSVVDLGKAPQGSNGEVKTTAAMSKYFKDYAGEDIPEGTPLPVGQVAMLTARGQKVADAQRLIEKTNGEKMDADLKNQIRADLQNPAVVAGLSSVPGRPILGVVNMQKAVKAQTDKIAADLATLQKANPNDPRIPAMQKDLKDHQEGLQALGRVSANAFSDKAREDEIKAQDEERKERHDEREEQIQNRRLDIQAQKETQQKGLGDSYKTENKEFDTIRKPLSTQLDSFSTLRSSLDQGTAVGDSVVAPALLKALVAGGGVRITQAEIHQFIGARSSVEDMKAILQKMQSGKSITPEQRKQVYSLLGAVESKVRAKNDILNDAQESLDGAQTVADQRKAVSDARRKLDAIDAGQQVQQAQQPTQQNPATQQKPQNQQGQTLAHQVGDTIVQNGRTFRVTSVDANGKVTGAN
jgi:hypothetical protein